MTDWPERASIADAKARFSELLSRVHHKHERFILERRGRPVAALVPVQDLEKLEAGESPRGALALVGAWKDFPEMDDIMADVYASRRYARERPVPKLED